ncbi:hypothetical protein JTE90_001441 [Oedothorax gibbosus]|uniref:DUF885 domain-containing protein n=1 Tax=Oedothorax gibbosus TaxID=931172 RepID=A0AAV6V2A7_9ARAC|nr:hypothetical protein JTE90_001441 [Oedothorax gibbosus]
MKYIRFFGFLAIGAVMVVSQDTSTAPHLDASQVENLSQAMFDEYWDLTLQLYPEKATILGDERFGDRLSSYSLQAYEKIKVMLNEFLERANQLLSETEEGSETQTNLGLFVTNIRKKLDYIMSGSHLFPVSKMYTPEMSLRKLLRYTKLNNAQQYWNLIARYRAIPTQIDEQIELFREGIRTNYTLSDRSMFTSSINLEQNVTDSPFYKPFLNITNVNSTDETDELQQNATDAIINHLIPAFKKLDDFLKEEYSLHVRPGIGVGSLPNGREFYIHSLSYHLTDTNVTPEEIHQVGLQEVQRITEEMNEVIKSLGYNMTQKEFSDQLRRNESQYFTTEAKALETYREVLEHEITPKLLQLFKFIPDKKLTVEKVPKELSAGPMAYYSMPSPDNSTPGTFWLDTTNLGNVPKYDVVTLAMHEGVPGHHFQYSYIMEQKNVPDFRKYDVHSSAFGEGWALYAEYLGYELGLYEDPYMRYGHLSYEIFRACRMVVDTGIHVLGWSRQQAIDYMVYNSAHSLDSIEREVDRYITWPGQACAYKYGELKIKEMRKKAESVMGPEFDIKEFHDIILRNNGPLELVAKQVDRYIATTARYGTTLDSIQLD